MSSLPTENASTTTGVSFCNKKLINSHIRYKDVFIYVPFIHEVEKILRVPVVLYDEDDLSIPTHLSSAMDFHEGNESILQLNHYGRIVNTAQTFSDHHHAKISKRLVFRRNTSKSAESQPLHRSLIKMFLYNKHVSQLYRQNAIHLPLGYFTVSDYKRLQSLRNKPWETICYRPVIQQTNTDLYQKA